MKGPDLEHFHEEQRRQDGGGSDGSEGVSSKDGADQGRNGACRDLQRTVRA